MRIRPVHRHDLPGIVAIETETLSPWSSSSLLSDLSRSANKRLFVVEERNTSNSKESGIVGWYLVGTVFPEAELLKIAVKTTRRNRGVGKQLLDHLIETLAEDKFEKLFLEVRSRNQTALKLYKKNGFVQVARRCKYYHKPVDDALILQKILRLQ